MVDYERLNWQTTHKKLCKEVTIAERTMGHFHDDEEFLKERRELLRTREDYITRTQKRLQSFKTALTPIRERLEDICQGHAGADVLQPLLESYEKKLTDFKILMRDEFVELENEEMTLTKDMQIAFSRLEGCNPPQWKRVIPPTERREIVLGLNPVSLLKIYNAMGGDESYGPNGVKISIPVDDKGEIIEGALRIERLKKEESDYGILMPLKL